MNKFVSLLLGAVLFLGFTAKADEGMWLLSLLKKQNIEKMQEMGCKLSAEDIYDINKACLKDAIVGLAHEGRPFRHFCTGEIISGKGLVLTNHHCGFSALQSHSTTEHDYLADGFWAYNHGQELTNPGITASILVRIEDVTDKVVPQLSDDMSEGDRHMAVSKLSKQIASEALAGTNYKGHVQSMFNGNQYFLFVYEIYRDVRLVGAPPQSMGKFGGDTDNWMWPRHTADFCMFRIYTAPDGSPAGYSKNNVPLKPKYSLPVSAKGVKAGDFAMIMGFPGTTDRYLTSYGLKETMDITNDIRYNVRTEKLRVMKEGMNKSQKTRIQYAAKYAQCANYWKYSFEQNKALRKLNTMGNKQQIEKEFTAWVNENPERKAKYGNALELIKEGYEAKRDYAKYFNYTIEALAGPEAHMFAQKLMAFPDMLDNEEVPADKLAMIIEKVRTEANGFYKDFNPEVEKNLIANLFRIYSENVAADFQPEIFKIIKKKYKNNFEKFAADMYKKSIFMSEERFNKFLDDPKKKTIQKDLLYVAGKSFFEAYMKLRALTTEMSTKIEKGNRLFVDGLMQMNPEKAWAPDANSTIRLTYGKVGGYNGKDGVIFNYYTTMTGIIEKEDPNNDEFVVPARLKELYNAKDFGPYAENGMVNTCFITDNDITGGNSGSPVINANGELIGTAFDGNSEAMSGDIDFEENLQRCINLDARYMLWIVDKFAGAKNLIEEMNIVK